MTDIKHSTLTQAHDQLLKIAENIDTLKNDLEAISLQIENLARGIAHDPLKSIYAHENAIICKKMSSLTEKGLSRFEAAEYVAEETGFDVSHILGVFALENESEKAIERRAIHKLITLLLNRNYSKREIARIAGYSEKYIYEFLRSIEPVEKSGNK